MGSKMLLLIIYFVIINYLHSYLVIEYKKHKTHDDILRAKCPTNHKFDP